MDRDDPSCCAIARSSTLCWRRPYLTSLRDWSLTAVRSGSDILPPCMPARRSEAVVIVMHLETLGPKSERSEPFQSPPHLSQLYGSSMGLVRALALE